MYNTQKKPSFIYAVAVLNAILIPLAGSGLYIAYVGGTKGDKLLLLSGVVLVVLSPFLSYLLALAILKKTLNTGGKTKPIRSKRRDKP